MADLAKEKLLRLLTAASAAIAISAATPAFPEEQPPVAFAPGATGAIRAPLTDIVRDAERRGEELGEELTIQPAQPGVEVKDLAQIRERALNDPRVKALLGVQEELDTEGAAEKYSATKGLLFASFSMPETSLRQMMREANTYGLTVVFRGFVNNSVFDTRARLEEVFAEDEDGEAFAIDPTLFQRFQIKAVPVLVVLAEELDTCTTPACETDLPPRHDRVAGNVPVETALRLIVAGAGDAAAVARDLMEGAK
ncbi:hypothetical protein SDC9_38250 [bioreactor metagenome]|uniref:Type-F conjugative transfer system pilin assembly protein TrbC n=1 Tax=bioreactor metagenome TaxID=1076179 RepID=A0A644VNV9_9ZZZZ